LVPACALFGVRITKRSNFFLALNMNLREFELYAVDNSYPNSDKPHVHYSTASASTLEAQAHRGLSLPKEGLL
jgi:hypothetical protein